MDWFVSPPPPAWLPIAGSNQHFAVHRIWCVGRNYAAHAREMGSDPDREPPFFFAKPNTALVHAATGAQAAVVPYPRATADLHHEVELVLALGAPLQNASPNQAVAAIGALAVGIDLTRRDVQNDLKKRSLPWEMAKAFDHSAVCGTLQPVNAQDYFSQPRRIGLRVNGAERQAGTTAELIWSTAELLQHLSKLVDLHAGDLVYTGTPAGVGALRAGDHVHCEAEGLPPLEIAIGQ